MNDNTTLLERWRAIHASPPPGWDVGGVGARIDGPDWSYEAVVRDCIAAARPASVLDIGTGGGEVLGRLADVLPTDTVATEGWPPNVPVASDALAPLGIDVVRYDATADDRMPFRGGRFDLVLDRHEVYDAREIARVLTPRGVFVTQQVDGRSYDDFDRLFGTSAGLAEVNIDGFNTQLVDAGLTIERSAESVGTVTYPTVDAMIAFLSMAPWSAPGFDVGRYAGVLSELHRTGEPIVTQQRWFLIVARRGRPVMPTAQRREPTRGR